MLQKKQWHLDAAALHFVLYLIVVVAIFLLSLLGWQRLNALLLRQRQLRAQYYELFDIPFLEVVPESKLQLDIKEWAWGAYTLQRISDKQLRMAPMVRLLGKSQSPAANTALFVQNNGQKIVMAGENTSVRGSIYYPDQGVIGGSVAGKYCDPNVAHQGTKTLSPGSLPPLQTSFYTAQEQVHFDREDDWNDVEGDEVRQEFTMPAYLITSQDSIYLSAIGLHGNIVVHSDQAVIVDSTAQLSDILIEAPNVRFLEGFKGSVHVLATESILLEYGVQLNYPSSLWLNAYEVEMNAQITMEQHTLLEGIAIFTGASDSDFPALKMHQQSRVFGQIYCEGAAQLAEVEGGVWTHDLITHYQGGRYLHHLIGAQIRSFNTFPLAMLPWENGQAITAKQW